MRTMLDLFCGRWGWSRAFAARGWKCVGIDLKEPDEIPENCIFSPGNVMDLDVDVLRNYDFICASSPCEQFAKFGMKMFWPNPPYPESGIELFNHTKEMLEKSGKRWVMENVRTAQQFVGGALQHCGPFYLWGNAVPPLMPQGIIKGMTREAVGYREYKGAPQWNRKHTDSIIKFASRSKQRREAVARNATIPPELANCVADYAERLLEQ